MYEKDVAQLYKKRQIESSTPGQLVIMMYDAVIENLTKAERILIEIPGAERIEKYHNTLITAQNIITELMVALDLERGGEIAQNLLRLYEYINYRLVMSNIRKAPDALHEVKKILLDLRHSWAIAVERELTEEKPILQSQAEDPTSSPIANRAPAAVPPTSLNITG
jgi:flagellar protein FliS